MDGLVSADSSFVEQAHTKKMRKRNPRGEGERLRAEIIEAAIRLLARLGADEPFSLRAVAKEAHITAPAIYIHFGDKTVLLLAVIEALFAQMDTYYEAAEHEAVQQSGDAWNILLARAHAYVRFGLEQPGHYRVLYDGRAILRLEDPRTVGYGMPVLLKTAELIREIHAAKGADLTSEHSERLALLFWTSLHGIVSLQINKPTIEWPSAYELAEQVTRALIKGD